MPAGYQTTSDGSLKEEDSRASGDGIAACLPEHTHVTEPARALLGVAYWPRADMRVAAIRTSSLA